jgi:hypothetical protein
MPLLDMVTTQGHRVRVERGPVGLRLTVDETPADLTRSELRHLCHEIMCEVDSERAE